MDRSCERRHGRLARAAHAMVAVLIRSPSSSGLGHRPFKAAARVRTPLGTQDQTAFDKVKRLVFHERTFTTARVEGAGGSETAIQGLDGVPLRRFGSFARSWSMPVRQSMGSAAPLVADV